MAGIRKLRGKWYVRVFLENGKEKLLPTKTGDRKQAEIFKRKIEEREFLVRARLAEKVTECRQTLYKAVDEYLKDCQCRLREKTCVTYSIALRHLKSCWGDLDLRQISPSHVTSFRQYLDSWLNPNSVNINLRAARTFLNWLVETERVERPPGKIQLVKVDQELPKFFTPDELEKVFKQVSHPKLKAVFRLLAETGLRRSELFKCTLEGDYLHLHQTKGRKERLVRIPQELIPDFLLATEDPLSEDYISHAFTRAVREAGIKPNGRSLHSLRHTFALREYARTKDIYLVKGLLGHSSVTVTEVYMRYPEQYLAQVFGDKLDSPVKELAQEIQDAGERLAFQA